MVFEENVAFSLYCRAFWIEMLHFHCTIVLLGGPGALGPWAGPMPGPGARARDNRAPTFLLEIETPIEVEHFDPQKTLYCRHFENSDVQKHTCFD